MRINLFEPTLGELELQKISEVFQSKWLGKGGAVKEFERKFSDLHGLSSENFLTTTCCTEGLFLAPKLFNWQEGDEIIVPVISFPAVASAIIECGAVVVFCDVDSRSLNVTPDIVEKYVTNKTKGIVITHYGGIPADFDGIRAVLPSDAVIVEDSACAINSTYKGRPVGCLGDMGVWSFDAMKAVTTGDGGMIYLKDKALRDRAVEWLYLGLPASDKSGLDKSDQSDKGWWEFELEVPGKRAIMNNIQGAMGVVQLDRLPDFQSIRKRNFDYYLNELKNIEGLLLPPNTGFEFTNSYYFFWIQTEKRNELAKYLLDKGIYTTFRYWPLHKVSLFFNLVDGYYSEADLAAENTLNIPVHQSLSEDDLKYIVESIKDFFERD
ncbi:DegT/DnrJ/EryC1/StrS family aminotransferase [Pseudomonas sp. HK3]